MPPLKEPVITPPRPEPAVEQTRSTVQIYPKTEDKPKIQPREVAQKAMKEISTVPPRLMLFSILSAVALILVVALGVFFHVRSEDDDATVAPRPAKTTRSAQADAETDATATANAKSAQALATPMDTQPNLGVRQVEKRAKVSRTPTPAPAPVLVPGQALVDSTPQGAQVQVDGKSDPSWITPFNVTGLGPGKHLFSVSKSGYTAEIRSLDVTAGSKAALNVRLAPMNALMVVGSTPPGAEIILDGKTTKLVTPSQFAVEKGNHTLLLRKQGFLEETVTSELGPGQNFQYSPALRALGNADEIKTVGKFNKLFGRGGDNAAGMGFIGVRTTPRGAQIAINQRMLDKLSPVDVTLGPGNYVVDITLTGFKPVHKVVSVDKGSRLAVDETLERQ